MTALLDTHALLFWVYEPDRLARGAKSAIADRRSRLLWSVASTWDAAIKVGLGKLRLDRSLDEVLSEELPRQAIEVLPIVQEHALRVASLPRYHGDPFDRRLVAQALVERVPLITVDGWAARYGAEVIW
ncbi:MAG: type II toxin-antitoxin system VapC family toxin [Deltaproteobacteria bacterium]|nr:type II toxin-antitoxin system VapC family toxin [Deltaproteobacteria bacterium]